MDTEEPNQETLIKVIGVGGGGGNAIQHMIESGVTGVEFVCINTDLQALQKNGGDHSIQLGSKGLGAGAKPEVAREAAETAEAEIRRVLTGCSMVFITAGFGGGTGTGAAPVIARIAKEMGILTVGVVTKPFTWEGPRRMRNADEALLEMENNVHSLLVVLNSKLEDHFGEDVKQADAFAGINQVLMYAVGGICEIIYGQAEVNADFEDVCTVLGEPGRAMMGTGVASGPDRARIAAEQAIACPLLEGLDLTGVKGVLVMISASKESLKLAESRIAMSTINEKASDQTHVIYGMAYDESLGDAIRVTVIATGLGVPAAEVHPQRQNMQLMQGGMGVFAGSSATAALQQPDPLSGVAAASSVPNGIQPGTHNNPPPATPHVWRQRDKSPGAASSSQRPSIDAIVAADMETYKVPTFLRQAD